jgi:predicted secreted Zn-dependent protease
MPAIIENPDYENKTKIYWDPNYQLKISDFKRTTSDSKYPSFSHLSFDPDFEIHSDEERGKYSIKLVSLRTFFVPELSLYNHEIAKEFGVTKEQEDGLVLHEQGHFDLAEEFLSNYKKKFQSQFKVRVFSSLDDLYDKINEFTKKISDEHMKIQVNYDKETNHGTIGNVQKVYNNKFKNFRKNYNKKK